MLLKGQRIGDLAFNRADRSLWGLRTNNGYVILVRIPYPYTEWQTVHVFSYGEVAFDLDVSPDGTLVSTSLAGLDSSRAGAQVMQVRVMKTDSLLAGDATPLRTLEFGSSVPEGFMFSRDNKYLFGSAYYTGVSNIYRYEIVAEEDRAVSNAEIGILPAGAPFGKRAARIQLHRAGFRACDDSACTDRGPERDHLSRRADRHQAPVVQGWSAGSPARIDVRFPDRAAGDLSYRHASSRSRPGIR